MIKYIKNSKSDQEKDAEDKQVRSSVEKILSDIKKDGDKAIKFYSEKFDEYLPNSFKLSENEIENCLKNVSKRDLEDIKFAQKQIRNFAFRGLDF